MKPLRRALLKLSGEALTGPGTYGIDLPTVERIAAEIDAVHRAGTQLGLVVGGGNIFRGLGEAGRRMDRVAADHMGMLATVINSLALRDALERRGVPARLLTAIEMRAVAEPYSQRRALRHLEHGHPVILAGGTGNPFFTTDTAAALRACELGAEALLKATRVQGVYSADPREDADAQLLAELTYEEALGRKLRVMDATAFSLCMESGMPIHVFDLTVPGNILRVVRGERVGSVVRADDGGS